MREGTKEQQWSEAARRLVEASRQVREQFVIYPDSRVEPVSQRTARWALDGLIIAAGEMETLIQDRENECRTENIEHGRGNN